MKWLSRAVDFPFIALIYVLLFAAVSVDAAWRWFTGIEVHPWE